MSTWLVIAEERDRWRKEYKCYWYVRYIQHCLNEARPVRSTYARFAGSRKPEPDLFCK